MYKLKTCIFLIITLILSNKFCETIEINLLSHECQRQLDAFPQKFLEANSHFPIEATKLPNLGNYEFCKQTNGIQGIHQEKMKYCLVQIKMNNLDEYLNELTNGSSKVITRYKNLWIGSSVFGMCIPKQCCQHQDFVNLLERLQNAHNKTISDFLVQDITCDDFELSSSSYFIKNTFILLTIFVVLVNFFATNTNLNNNKWMECFSVKRHLLYLFYVNPESKIQAINGLRTISTFWVIYGHICEVNMHFPCANPLNTFKWVESYKSIFVIMAPMAVDQFLLISGFLIGYKQKRFLTAFPQRIISIILPMYPMVLMFHTFLNDMGTGESALWLTTTKHLKYTCGNGTYWWSSYLLIHNYYNSDQMCAGHTWYLAMDIQLFLLSPLILFILKKHLKCAYVVFTASILISCLWTFTIAYKENLGATPQKWTQGYFTRIYFVTHLRSPVWLIGVLGGHLYSQKKFDNLSENCKKYCWYMSWGIFIGIIIFSMEAPFRKVSILFSSVFSACHRLLWSLAVIWIIVACANKNCALLGTFLSMKMFVPLSKLSYCIYLTHAAVQLIVIGNRKQPFYFDGQTNGFDFLHQLLLTLFVSLYWYLTIQCPIVSLFSLLLIRAKNTNKIKVN